MIKTRFFIGVLVVACSGLNLKAFGCGPQAAADTEGLAGAITVRLRAIEKAWNRGDESSIFSQYDRSMVAILESNFLDYAHYRDTVKSMMAEASRPNMKLDINVVRPLGARYALVNGRVHMIERSGSDQASPFTIIYRYSGGQWMIVYAHS